MLVGIRYKHLEYMTSKACLLYTPVVIAYADYAFRVRVPSAPDIPIETCHPQPDLGALSPLPLHSLHTLIEIIRLLFQHVIHPYLLHPNHRLRVSTVLHTGHLREEETNAFSSKASFRVTGSHGTVPPKASPGNH